MFKITYSSTFSNKLTYEKMPMLSTEKKDESIRVSVSIYHATVGQTDSTPLVTASNRTIDTNKLREGRLKWVALSHNLLKRFGGPFDYGDKIRIIGVNKKLDGIYLVHDCMNKMYRNKVDILVHETHGKYGYWKDVKIIKVD